MAVSDDARVRLVVLDGGAEPSRDAVRSRRKRAVRAKTVSSLRTPMYEVRSLTRQADYDEMLVGPVERPRTRADCIDGPRPCPWVSCRHHLYLDVSPATRAVKLNFPDIEPGELPERGSCALDVADDGGCTLELTGELMNLTRERARQIEEKVLRRRGVRDALRGLHGGDEAVQPHEARTTGGRGQLAAAPDSPEEDEEATDQEPEEGLWSPERRARASAWRNYARIGAELAAGGHLARPEEYEQIARRLAGGGDPTEGLGAACKDPLYVQGIVDEVARVPAARWNDHMLDELAVERWSNEVVAEMRAGMPLRQAMALADEPFPDMDEEPPVDLFRREPMKSAPLSLVTPAERRSQPPRSVEHLIPREDSAKVEDDDEGLPLVGSEALLPPRDEPEPRIRARGRRALLPALPPDTLCRCGHPVSSHRTGEAGDDSTLGPALAAAIGVTGFCAAGCGCTKIRPRRTPAMRRAEDAEYDRRLGVAGDEQVAKCPALKPRGGPCSRPAIYGGLCVVHGKRREAGIEVRVASSAIAATKEKTMTTRGERNEETNEVRERVHAFLQKHGPMAPRDLVATLGDDEALVRYAFRTLVDDKTCEIVGRARGSRWQIKGDERAATTSGAPAAKPAQKTGKAKAGRAGGNARAAKANGKANGHANGAGGSDPISAALATLKQGLLGKTERLTKAIDAIDVLGELLK